MRPFRHQLFVASTLLMAGCDQPAIDASQSLVGAKKLPAARTLQREVIQIIRGSGNTSSSVLSYELRPDNSLTITLTHRDPDTRSDITDEKETFKLASSIAWQARRDLWRLRPEILQGIEQVVRPADCPPPPTDTFSEAAVAFIAEGPKPGIEDDQVGVIDVPTQYTCDTGQGREARSLVEQVLKSFPQSKAAADFNRPHPPEMIPLL